MLNSTSFPKWDAHHHLWHYHPESMGWIPRESIRRDFLLPEWESTLDLAGIDQSILVQVHQSWEETQSLQAISSQSNRIVGVVGWINLMDAELDRYWETLPEGHKVVGFRHILQAEEASWFEQPALKAGIRSLGRHHFSYDVLITQSQLPQAAILAAACENTRLIVDHLAKPEIGQPDRSAWERGMKELAQMPHVAVKLSGFTTECPDFQWKESDFIPYFDFLLDHFGPNRLMVGSDWPVCLMAASYQEQMSIVETWMARLSASEKENLWSRTAQTWYGL